MTVLTQTPLLTPEDVERASERDGKIYELLNGELREKQVGAKSLFIATQIASRMNQSLYPTEGFAAVEVMIYCFKKQRHGRKPDVVYVRMSRLPNGEIPDGDIFVAPDLVVEVLSPSNSGYEVEDKLQEYLGAGVALVWIVHPDRQTIRVYRQDGSARLYKADDTIAGEAVLPGFSLKVGDVFPPVSVQPG